MRTRNVYIILSFPTPLYGLCRKQLPAEAEKDTVKTKIVKLCIGQVNNELNLTVKLCRFITTLDPHCDTVCLLKMLPQMLKCFLIERLA